MLMHNPPHPGRVLREYLGEIEIAEAANRLRVTRTTLSRIVNGRAGISAEMSLRLSQALGTHAGFWLVSKWTMTSGMQAANLGRRFNHFARRHKLSFSS